MPPLLPVILIVFLGGVLQGAAGFGYGMFAIPLLVLLGVESYEAITIVLVTGVVQTAWGAWLQREHVMWKQIAWMLTVAAVTIPLGVITLERLAAASPGTVRRVFGAIIFLGVVVQWFGRWEPRDSLHPVWGVGATTISGYMAGLAGMGGPPVVIWVMAQTWSNRRSRATLWAFFTGITPVQIFFLAREFGAGEILHAAGTGALLVPATVLGALPGMWLGHRLSKQRLRQVAFSILLLISVYAMLNPAGCG